MPEADADALTASAVPVAMDEDEAVSVMAERGAEELEEAETTLPWAVFVVVAEADAAVELREADKTVVRSDATDVDADVDAAEEDEEIVDSSEARDTGYPTTGAEDDGEAREEREVVTVVGSVELVVSFSNGRVSLKAGRVVFCARFVPFVGRVMLTGASSGVGEVSFNGVGRVRFSAGAVVLASGRVSFRNIGAVPFNERFVPFVRGRVSLRTTVLLLMIVAVPFCTPGNAVVAAPSAKVIVEVTVTGGIETKEVTFCPARDWVIVLVCPGMMNWMMMTLTVTEFPPRPLPRPGEFFFDPEGKTPGTAL